MKKFLLSAVATATAVTMSAELTQDWQHTVASTFADGNTVYNAPVAFDNTGAVIATGVFNKETTIEGTALENIGNSAYIIKYGSENNTEWVIPIIGSVTISKIVTDESNNIYVAGQYADEITFGTTSGDEIVKEGMTFDGEATIEQNSAFIAKYTPTGAVETVRTFIPQIQPDLIGLVDDWEAETMYWYFDGVIEFRITDLGIVGDRLYVATVYTGVTEIDDIKLDASYVNYLFFMYSDNQCAAIISLDNSLADAKIIDEITSTVNNGDYTENTYEVWNARFDSKGDDMVVAYTGTGELNYQGSVIDLVEDDENNVSPVFIFSTFKGGQFVGKKVIVTESAMINSFNQISGVSIIGDNAYAVGHKYSAQKDDANTTYTNDIFVAVIPGLDVENTTINTTVAMTDDYYYQSTGAAFTANGEIYVPTVAYYQNASDNHKKGDLAGNGTTFLYSAEAFSATDYNATAAAADGEKIVFSQVSSDGTTFTLYTNDAAGIDDITVDDSNAPVEYFNLQGVKVANPENGLFIIRQGNTTTKQIIR